MKYTTLRRLLSLAAALALTLSVSASAAFSDQEAITHGAAVDALVTLNLLQGRTDGSFDPGGPVTRAELSKIASSMLMGGKPSFEGLFLEDTASFPDVKDHWALDHIRFCAARGIIAGRADGRFDPDAAVTGLEGAKMLLICTGYLPDEAGLTGAGWDTATQTLAQERGLLTGLEALDLTAPLTRDAAAQLVHNTLGSGMVYYDDILTSVDGKLTTALLLQESGETMLSVYFDKE